MRTRNRVHMAVAMTAALLMIFASVALADNLQDDVMAAGNGTFTAGGSTTVNYHIVANGSDGCNVDADNSATMLVNAPAGLAANPTSLVFTACAAAQSVVYSTNTPGSYDLVPTISGGKAGNNGWNANPARSTLTVNPTTNVAPTVSYLLSPASPNGLNGWYTSAVGITWTITGDPAPSTSADCGVTSVSADGEHSLTCEATNSAGTDSATAVFKIDQSAPNAPTIVLAPAPNAAGWNKSDVAVSFTANGDNGPSGVASCTAGFTVSSETAGQLVSGTCTDHAGNESAAATRTVKLDKTAPSIADLGPTIAPNPAGWYKNDVVNTFQASDLLSGLPGSFTNPFTQTTTGEGAAVTVSSGPVADVADNTNPGIDSAAFQIDKTLPVVAVTGVTHGATYTLGSVPAAGCSTSDALSGVATHASLGTSGGPVGSVTVNCTGAADVAGNTNSASATYNVVYDFGGWQEPVKSLPIRNTVKAGRAIPIKFSLGGDQGMAIFNGSGPKWSSFSCTAAPTDPVDETIAAGSSSLQYDPATDTYTYVWKSDAKWANSCTRLALNLKDGSTHIIDFQFTK